MKEIHDEIISYFRQKKDLKKYTDDDLLKLDYIEQHLLDSIEMIDMITQFEEQFNVTFSDDEMQMPEFRTIGGLIGIVSSLSRS